jgi:hypothetical protein
VVLAGRQSLACKDTDTYATWQYRQYVRAQSPRDVGGMREI